MTQPTSYVTVHLINAAFRRDHKVPPSETFMVVHHQGQAAEVVGTDEDLPGCLTPQAWAQDLAAHRGVPYVEPAADICFLFNRGAGRWYAVRQPEVEDDGWVPNPYAAALPPIEIRVHSRVPA